MRLPRPFPISIGVLMGALLLASSPAEAVTTRWSEDGILHVRVDQDELVAQLGCRSEEILWKGPRIHVACGSKGHAVYDTSRGLTLRKRFPDECFTFVVEDEGVSCVGSAGQKGKVVESTGDENEGVTYSTRGGILAAISSGIETRVPVVCDWITGSLRDGDSLYLACGARGMAVYDVSGSVPRLVRSTSTACGELTTEGGKVLCASSRRRSTLQPSTATNVGARTPPRSKAWIGPVVIGGVLLGFAAVVGVVAMAVGFADGLKGGYL